MIRVVLCAVSALGFFADHCCLFFCGAGVEGFGICSKTSHPNRCALLLASAAQSGLFGGDSDACLGAGFHCCSCWMRCWDCGFASCSVVWHLLLLCEVPLGPSDLFVNGLLHLFHLRSEAQVKTLAW